MHSNLALKTVLRTYRRDLPAAWVGRQACGDGWGSYVDDVLALLAMTVLVVGTRTRRGPPNVHRVYNPRRARQFNVRFWTLLRANCPA